jgi:hypothetical protein
MMSNLYIYIFQDGIDNRSTTRLYAWPITSFLKTIVLFLNANIDSWKNYLYIFYTPSS